MCIYIALILRGTFICKQLYILELWHRVGVSKSQSFHELAFTLTVLGIINESIDQKF